MKRIMLILLFVLFSFVVVHAEETIHRVIMLGNSADIDDPGVYDALEGLVKPIKGKFTVIINGDLIPGNPRDYEEQVKALLDSVTGNKNGRVIIIAGERDWMDSGENGWEYVQELESMVIGFNYKNVRWAHKNGKADPKSYRLDDSLNFMAINTQWHNHLYDKPTPTDRGTVLTEERYFEEEMVHAMDDPRRMLLVAGHYPIFSYGEYGGHMQPVRSVLPPILGGFLVAHRMNVGTSKDIINENYEGFRKKLEDQFLSRESQIYFSAHDQNLQILRKGNNYFINSGSIGASWYAKKGKDALISSDMQGLIELVYYEGGRIEAIVYEYKDGSLAPHSDFTLFRAPYEAGMPFPIDTPRILIPPINTAYTPEFRELDIPSRMSGTYDEPVTVHPGDYDNTEFIRFIGGDHYREVWLQDVKIPYLDLDNTYGGLKPYRRGGGKQTISLRFRAGNGKRYVFRLVDKNMSSAIHYTLVGSFVARAAQDQTSALNPYSPIIVESLQNELGLLALSQLLCMMPDDERLGPFKKEFGGKLGTLEEFATEPDFPNEVPFHDADMIAKSNECFRELYDDHNTKVDVDGYVISRMLDILVGDIDRHEDNYKWAGYETDEGLFLVPIPRDRDLTFVLTDGVLPWIADREWATPILEGFRYDIKGLRSLNWQARYQDRFLLSMLNLEDWLAAARFVQENLTDEVIEASLKTVPQEAYDLMAEEILGKLKKRRDDLQRYAKEYYLILAKEVDVVASNKDEYFQVERNEDGTVKVAVYKLDEGVKGDAYYQRLFHPRETKEIRLFGLSGEDVFFVSGEVNQSIKVRVVGGRGKDEYIDQSRVKKGPRTTLVYELDEDDSITKSQETKIVKTDNRQAYDYNRTSFAYDTYLPLFGLNYDGLNSLVLSYGVKFTTQRYDVRRVVPEATRFSTSQYSSTHKLKGYAGLNKNLKFEYDGRFQSVLNNWDVFLGLSGAFPDFRDVYFGYGNNTVKDDVLYGDGYYTYDLGTTYHAELGIVRDFWKKSSLDLMVGFDSYEGLGPLSGDSIFDTGPYALDCYNILETGVGLDLDMRDSKIYPLRGKRLNLEYQHGFRIDDLNENYGKALGYIESFNTVGNDIPLTLGLRVGGGYSHGGIPFHKLHTLGGNNYLRGYMDNRFAGERIAFANADLRIQLVDKQTKVIPLKFGFKPFFDVGKVLDGSDEWHYGYGVGAFAMFWQEPYVLNLSVAFSDEESLLLKIAFEAAFE